MSKQSIFTTPESRRRMADVIESFSPADAARYRARAAMEEQDRLGEYMDALDAWRAAEPDPLNFIDAESAAEIRRRRDEALVKSRAEAEKLWGGFIDAESAAEIRRRRDEALVKSRAEAEKLWGGFTAKFSVDD